MNIEIKMFFESKIWKLLEFYGSGSSESFQGATVDSLRANGAPRAPAVRGNDLNLCHRMLCLWHKITLSSNTGDGHNFFVSGIRRVTVFYAYVKGGVQFFSLNNILEFNLQPSLPDNF